MYSGTGIYSLREASRLIDVPSPKIHRWLYGYNYHKKSGEEKVQSFSAPLWEPQLSKIEYEAEVIGFNDLLEIRFVAAFVKHGVPLTVVRRCLETASELSKSAYPMSTGHFKTDGKTIFSETLEALAKEGELLDLKTRQLVFREVISPSLYAGIEYNGNLATKWYPQGHGTQVVLDPTRHFGSPILDKTGMSTDILYASYLAEGGTSQAIKTTAKVYETPLKLVESAIKFEQGLIRKLH
ncbi:MAG: DUF433 domain-containing protein [Burkholderiaceae bacterium]